ncbi:MAG TPA: hypothetical protein PLR12_05125 [Clostridia bacterium]|nr:hypothetical protein [Clostridia bacterium]
MVQVLADLNMKEGVLSRTARAQPAENPKTAEQAGAAYGETNGRLTARSFALNIRWIGCIRKNNWREGESKVKRLVPPVFALTGFLGFVKHENRLAIHQPTGKAHQASALPQQKEDV